MSVDLNNIVDQLSSLTVLQAAELAKQAPEPKRSADLFEKAGDFHQAAEEHARAGDALQAARAYEAAFDYAAAIEAYRNAGERGKALELLEKTGRFFEAGGLAIELGESDRALRCFQQVGPREPEYADACDALAKLFSERRAFDRLHLDELIGGLRLLPDRFIESPVDRHGAVGHARRPDALGELFVVLLAGRRIDGAEQHRRSEDACVQTIHSVLQQLPPAAGVGTRLPRGLSGSPRPILACVQRR